MAVPTAPHPESFGDSWTSEAPDSQKLENYPYQFTETGRGHQRRFTAQLHPSLCRAAESSLVEQSLASPSYADPPNVVLLTLVHNAESWGGNRSFSDYLAMTHTFLYPRNRTSIGLLVSSFEEFDAMKETLTTTLSSTIPIPSPFGLYARITVIYKPPFDGEIDRGSRHFNHAQKERRRLIARLRNYLLSSVLRDEDDWVIWIDADIVKVPSEAVGVIVDSNKDIVTMRCVSGSNGDYDQWVPDCCDAHLFCQLIVSSGTPGKDLECPPHQHN